MDRFRPPAIGNSFTDAIRQRLGLRPAFGMAPIAQHHGGRQMHPGLAPQTMYPGAGGQMPGNGGPPPQVMQPGNGGQVMHPGVPPQLMQPGNGPQMPGGTMQPNPAFGGGSLRSQIGLAPLTRLPARGTGTGSTGMMPGNAPPGGRRLP